MSWNANDIYDNISLGWRTFLKNNPKKRATRLCGLLSAPQSIITDYCLCLQPNHDFQFPTLDDFK